jgi:predicted site-specific integrase-resolvase
MALSEGVIQKTPRRTISENPLKSMLRIDPGMMGAMEDVMSKRAAIYVRVSTDKQTIENQVRELRQIAERRGWEVVEQYSDAGISGFQRPRWPPWP